MNSELYNNTYRVPDDILNQILISVQKYRHVNTNGKKRANNILKTKSLTYQNLKRIKNYFDHIGEQYDIIEFNLNGGNDMREFVEKTLEDERKNLKRSKKNKSEYGGLNNQFIKSHEKENLVGRNNNFLTIESLDIKEEIKNISLGVLIHDNKILLLKRSINDDWCGGMWALAGGTSENGELPEETLIREIKEETNLSVIKHVLKKTIVNKNMIEHLFLIKSKDLNIKLDHEHEEYKFFSIDEIKNNGDQFVPNLLNYIKLAIK